MKFEGLHTAKVVTFMLLVYGLMLSLSACKGGGDKSGSDANTEKASADDGQSKRSINHAGNNAGSSQNVAPYNCGDILHGENEFRQFYSTSTVYQGQSCDDYKITLFRKCDNGVLGQWQGANRYYEKCTINQAQSPCSPEDTERKTFYKAAQVEYGQSCVSKTLTRTCKLNQEGDYVFQTWPEVEDYKTYSNVTCVVKSPLPCQGAAHGETITETYYTQNTSSKGSPCEAKTVNKTCLNGKFSYAAELPSPHYSVCNDGGGKSCVYQNKTYAHNAVVEKRVRYKSSVGDAWQACDSASNKEVQQRYCNNGSITSFDGSYTFPECIMVSNNWKVVNPETLEQADYFNNLTQRWGNQGKNLYACGGMVFIVAQNQYPTKYIASTTNVTQPMAATEELYFFTPQARPGNAENIERLTANHSAQSISSYPSTSLSGDNFKTDNSFLPKVFNEITCLDGKYLLFSLAYATNPRKKSEYSNDYQVTWKERYFIFNPATQKVSGASSELYALRGVSGVADFGKGVTSSSSILNWNKVEDASYDIYRVDISYLAKNERIIDLIDVTSNRTSAITLDHRLKTSSDITTYLRDWANALAAYNQADDQDICQRKYYNLLRPFSSVQLGKTYLVRFYSVDDGCVSSRDDLRQNYLFEICDKSTCHPRPAWASGLQIPAKYLAAPVEQQGYADRPSYYIPGVYGRLVNFDGQNTFLYLRPTNGQLTNNQHQNYKWSILKFNFERWLNNRSLDPADIFEEVAYQEFDEPLPQTEYTNRLELITDFVSNVRPYIPYHKGIMINPGGPIGITNQPDREFDNIDPNLDDGSVVDLSTASFDPNIDMAYDFNRNILLGTSNKGKVSVISFSSQRSYLLKPDAQNKSTALNKISLDGHGYPVFVQGNSTNDWAYFLGTVNIKPDNNSNNFGSMTHLFKVPLPRNQYP